MTELKTLKDILPKIADCSEEIMERELKTESVKWIDFLAESDKIEDNDKVNWIMHFFNLTEEDLKEEKK